MPDIHSKGKVEDYASSIAPVGHSPEQVPQLTHTLASMTRAPAPSLIAPTGHAGSHVPQFTHASVIL